MKKAEIHNLKAMDYTGTEALNTICSNLSFAGKNLKKIVFTSCSASDGKSFMTIQIAMNLAKRGRRVVLVDADLRRSVLVSRHHITLGENPMGLVHYLAGHCALEEAVYETNIPNAYLIPVGRNTSNPLPLLNSPEFQNMLDYCVANFDLVLVDAAPVGLVIDAAEIAKYCDGVVFVTRYRKTHARELALAKQQIEQANCPIIGCIINAVEMDSLSAKKNYSYSYYSHYNTSYYGTKDTKKTTAAKGKK